MLGNNTVQPSRGSQEEVPSADCEDYCLFLLEFFVKQASGDRLAKLNQMFFVPTSVRFEFLDFTNEDDLVVVPVDLLFQPQAGVANDAEVFNTGKSVLFAADYYTVMDRSVKLILKVIVKKQMPDNIQPDILVGTGELDLSRQFAALRLEMLQCGLKDVETSKVFDGQVPLIHSAELTGRLDVFVRISALGQTIVTDFDAPASWDDKTFVFGAEEVEQDLAYKFRKVDSCASDLFKDSNKDLRSTVTCPMCVVDMYPCIPCGKMAAVEERGEKIRGERDKMVIERRKLKYTTSKSLIQSSRGSTQLCGKAVVLKVSGLFDYGDGRKKPTVTVGDETAAAKPDDPSNPDHDIFVLRIGKKGLVGIGEKSDIQLEMKTPKGPERRPPIRCETREMQTEIKEEEPKEKQAEKKKIKKKAKKKKKR